MSDPRAAITAVWRQESTRLVAALVRMTREVELAEDLAQDALVAALEQWPQDGVPSNPGAWLMAVAKRRAVDHFRRAETLRRRTDELNQRREGSAVPDLDAAVDFIEDDVLRLIFLTCHPALSAESRTALTLRLVGGLTTAEIARAFMVKESTMGQRLSRAKRTLAESGVTVEAPVGQEREARLADVMAVIYLIFNEGYTATAGVDWMRPELCLEALRLARTLSTLVPDDPEVLGLQALLELQGSRTRARLDAAGQPVLLDDQDRSRWDRLLIRRGLRALDRAERLGKPVGGYVLQAEIAACHARALAADQTDWVRVAQLYDLLGSYSPGPVVELNRAVAHGRAHGPARGLRVLEAIGDPATVSSHLYSAVRGDLLARSGSQDEAAESFRTAAGLTANEGERALLLRRAQESASAMSKPAVAVRRTEDSTEDRSAAPGPESLRP